MFGIRNADVGPVGERLGRCSSENQNPAQLSICWISATQINEVLDKITSPIRLHRSKNFRKKFRKFCEVFRKLFDCFVISIFFSEIGRAETIHLVRKSSNFEPSSRFFGRLKIWTSDRTSSDVKIEDVIFSNMPLTVSYTHLRAHET